MINIGWTKPTGLFIEYAEVFLCGTKKDIADPKSKPKILAEIEYVDYNERCPQTHRNKFRIEIEAGLFILGKKRYGFINGDFIMNQIETMLEEFFN